MRCPTLDELPAPLSNKTGWPWTEQSPPLPDARPDGHPWLRLSIVTPSYNQGEFIEEAIRSVLLQGYPNLEYIVMDGGSTDNSVEIIEKYSPWLAYWVSEEDRGQSHAINKGFTLATGEIMGWLNSDDVYQKGAIGVVARELTDKEGTMLVGASIITDGPDKLSGSLDFRRPAWEEMAYDARTFPQPSTFWTYDLGALTGPVNEDLYFAMDYEFFLRMRMHTRELITVDTVLSYARTHPQQKSRRAERDDNISLFVSQRVYSALRGAKLRREHALIWLIRSWLRRLISAYQKKNVSLLRGSLFHKTALRVVLFKRAKFDV